MFQQFKNIDTAFKYTRVLSLVALVCSFSLTTFIFLYTSNERRKDRSKVLVINNGKVYQAIESDRQLQWPIEIKDHVKMFHFYLLTLIPDEKANTNNVSNALTLADRSALDYYENLKESGYYSNVVAANITQQVQKDSIAVNTSSDPWSFVYYGKLTIKRSTSTVVRSLISRGEIRILPFASEDNPHGLLIEKWSVIENRDLNH